MLGGMRGEEEVVNDCLATGPAVPSRKDSVSVSVLSLNQSQARPIISQEHLTTCPDAHKQLLLGLDTGPHMSNSKACIHMLAQTWSTSIAYHG